MIRRTLKLRRLRRDIRGLFRLWAVMKMSARWSEKAENFEAKHNAACREYNRTRFCFMRRRRLIGEPARDEREVLEIFK